MADRDPDADARRLAGESLAGGDAVAWFDRLYAAAAAGEAIVPWDHADPHPVLAEWTRRHEVDGTGRRALAVGCGTSGDAEHLASVGFDTVAFDISPAAIRSARERFPRSRVDYRVANLLDLPDDLRGAFDLVLEIMTVQALPLELRAQGTQAVASTVAPGGTLLVITSVAEPGVARTSGPPWPFTREEMEGFATGGLVLERLERLQRPGDRARWRAELRQPVDQVAEDPGRRAPDQMVADDVDVGAEGDAAA